MSATSSASGSGSAAAPVPPEVEQLSVQLQGAALDENQTPAPPTQEPDETPEQQETPPQPPPTQQILTQSTPPSQPNVASGNLFYFSTAFIHIPSDLRKQNKNKYKMLLREKLRPQHSSQLHNQM